MQWRYTSGKMLSSSQPSPERTDVFRDVQQVVVARDHEIHHVGPLDLLLYPLTRKPCYTVAEQRDRIRHDLLVLFSHPLFVLQPVVHAQALLAAVFAVGVVL